MDYALSLLLGYALGSINPAALISKLKKQNLRNMGTGNLGATNTALNFGKVWGAFVMLFDIAKSAGAVFLAKLLFPETALLSGLLAGGAAVVGHIFPFYMKFKGGKGLAAYGGMIFAFSPDIFIFLLCLGILCMIVFKRGVALTLSAAILFPSLAAFKYSNVTIALLAALVSIALILRHADNIMKARRGEDLGIRDFFNKVFGKEEAVVEEASKKNKEIR